MADESRQYVAELTREVVKLGGEAATGTTVSGKIYRAWMDVKATFTGKSRYAVLSNCEFGEDAAQKAYKEALDSDETLSIDIRQLIANQKASLKISHDTIKKYRDMYKDDDNDNDTNLSNSASFNDSEKYNSANSAGSSFLTEDDSLTGTKNTTGNRSISDIDDLTDGNGNNSGSGNLGNSGIFRNI
jgi:uncharacterized protein (TIGR02284 family)